MTKKYPESETSQEPATAWVLTDGKAGDETQCLAVAEALGLAAECRRVAPRAPWSWSSEDTRFPTAEETLASMQLDPDAWLHRCLCPISRMASGPEGQEAVVMDNILFLQRLT
jgi:hypothetical protein